MPQIEDSFSSENAPVKTITAVDEGLRAFMMRVYNYMAGGIALTGVVAYLTYFASVTQRTETGAPVLTAFGHAL